jgi:hypothetical protein
VLAEGSTEAAPPDCGGLADVTVDTVAQLQALSGCKTIPGSLTINVAVPDVAPLWALESVGGELHVSSGSTTSLHGLESLTTIGGGLVLDASVPDTDALASLASIDGTLDIEFADSLTSVRLPKLAAVGGITIGAPSTLADIELPAVTSTGSLNLYSAGASPAVSTLALPALSSVSGDLQLDTLALTSDATFASLASVGGALDIVRLQSLTQLGGFGSLTHVGVVLSVAHSTALTTITGFRALTSAGSLELIDLPSLTSFPGLASVVALGSKASSWTAPTTALVLNLLPKVTDLTGLSGLRTSYQDIEINSVNSLTSLHGLEALTTIGGELSLTNDTSLVSLKGLEGVTSVGLRVTIQQNPSLTSIGSLDAVTTIGAGGAQGPRGITIEANGALATLDGFNGLTQLANGASITIDDSVVLTSLGAFAKLESVGGQIDISFLPKLTTLGAFGALTSAGSLDIESDPLLPTCQAQKLLASLKTHGFAGTATISKDGKGTCP